MYRRLLIFFPPLPKWWWLQTPWFILFVLTTLFRWCQKGENWHDHDYFGLTWLDLTLYNLVSTLAWCVLALAYLCLLSIWSFGLSSSKRGNLLRNLLSSCNERFLMITNSNDTSPNILECVVLDNNKHKCIICFLSKYAWVLQAIYIVHDI